MQISMSIEDVRAVTGIGRTKIYQAINSGKLKAKKFGKKTIILRDDLELFLNSLETYHPEKTGA